MSVWRRPRAASIAGLALVLAWVGLGPARVARAQEPPDDPEIEGLPIGRLEIDVRDIYDPVPAGRLAALYRLANRLHIRTHEGTVRSQLLVHEGGSWNGARARETARALRALSYLELERFDARRAGDSVEVHIVTRDNWTTSPEFNLERGGGQTFGSASFTERNLLGLGKQLSIGAGRDPTGRANYFSYSDPTVGGSRFRFQYSGSDGTDGATDALDLGVPFYAEDTPYSYGVLWRRVTSVMRLYQYGVDVANLDRRLEETEIHWSRGTRVDGAIRRMTFSFLVRDRRLGPSRAQAGVPTPFLGGEENLKLRRLGYEVEMWRPEYVQRFGVNHMDRVEDFDLGDRLALKAGFSPAFLGSTEDELYFEGRLHAGTETPLGFGWLDGSIRSRARRTPLETVRRLDARWIVQAHSRQTLVLAALGIDGDRTARDFQVVLGGLNGLRAYPVQALAGRRAWRFNVEDRWVFARDVAQLVTVGAAAFVDAARAWGAGAGGTDWFRAAGAGLRVSLPHSALNQVVRFDVAFPLRPTRDGRREAVFSFGSSQAF